MNSKPICDMWLGIFAAALFLFSACSVDAPSQDGSDDEELSLNEKSKRVPAEQDESSKKGNSASNDLDDDHGDDDFDNEDNMSIDFGGGVTSTVSVDLPSVLSLAGNSSEEGEKYDCNFSVKDDVWNLDINKDNGTGTGAITFTDHSTIVDLDVFAEDSTAETCEQGAKFMNFLFGNMDNGDEFSFTCNKEIMHIKVHMTDTTQTAADKEDIYIKMCK